MTPDNRFSMTDKDREELKKGFEYRSNEEFIESISKKMQSEKRSDEIHG